MKTVLIVNSVYPFCVKWITAQKRMEAFSRYLPHHGWKAIFVTQACQCVSCSKNVSRALFIQSQETSEAVENDIVDYLTGGGDVLVFPCDYRPVHKLYQRMCSLSGVSYEAPHNMLRSMYFRESSFLSALPQALFVMPRKLVKGMSSFEEGDFLERTQLVADTIQRTVEPDLVLGSAPPTSSLEVACSLSNQMNVPWVADMRDSLLRRIQEISSVHMRFKKKQYIDFLRSASAMIHVTKQEAERDSSLVDVPSSVIENGYFHEEIREALQSPIRTSAFTLRFVGTVYSLQDWSHVIEGINLFLTACEMSSHDLRFEFYGDASNLGKEIERSDFMHSMGTVDRETALRLCAGADVLLHCTYNSPITKLPYHGIPGSKLYEYLALNRPLLAIGSSDDYVDELMRDSDRAWRCQSALDVHDALQIVYRDRVRYLEESREVSTRFQRYERKSTIARYAAVLDKLVEDSESL